MTDSRVSISDLLRRLKSTRLPASLQVVLVWLGISAFFVMRAVNTDFLALLKDTDDATRLVAVRDLMGGQDWFDHVQYRFNSPFGADVHWSRLIDLPLSFLINVLNALAPGFGERIALFVWPLVLLLPALALVVLLTRRLVGSGNDVVALIIAALAVPVFSEFFPGRIDHHNVQIVLVLWLVLEVLNAPRSNNATWRAGIAAATSLAIGAETILIVAAAIAVFGLNWVKDPAFAPRLRRFGASFAGAMLVHFLVAIGPDDWLAAKCDALSIVYLVAAFGVAAVFAALPYIPIADKAWGRRLGFGAASGVLILAVLLELFPGCAQGPFAQLSPWLRSAWLDQVSEALPVWRFAVSSPSYALAVFVPLLVAFGAATAKSVTAQDDDLWPWRAYLLMLVAVLAGAVLQMRGVRLAMLVAVPGAVAAVTIMRAFYLKTRGAKQLAAISGLFAIWIGASGLVLLVLFKLVFSGPGVSGNNESAFRSCLTPGAFDQLAGLSPGRIAAPIGLGPFIIAMTPHAVIGAPYHRNGDGIGDNFRIFGASEAQAHAILLRRGIDIVVSCAAMQKKNTGGLDADDSLTAQFEAGTHPDWLSPLPETQSPLRVYRVAR